MGIGFKAFYFKDLIALEEKNFWFRTRNKLILWALEKYSPAMKSFLEIGCGTGFVLAAIARRFPGAMLLGSEYLEEGLAFARQRVPDAEFVQMDARHIPYESRFEVVGSFDVLEHIEEDEAVLQQIWKALKPGGMALITVPQHRWLWSSIDEFACHVRRYRASELHQKARKAGFEIVRSTSFVSSLLPAMFFSRLRQRNKSSMRIDDLPGLRVNPFLNRLFEWLLDIELAMIRIGIAFPLGGSRLLVARKPTTPKDT